MNGIVLTYNKELVLPTFKKNLQFKKNGINNSKENMEKWVIYKIKQMDNAYIIRNLFSDWQD